MKAPHLFGYIAVALVALAVVYLALLFAVSARATRRPAHSGR